jgi:hypothetical protein
MPTLESKLVIGAKDETGGAFAAITKHIAALDKQIATFDKLMAATRGVAKANDPMIASIDRGAKALTEEKAALEGLARAMTGGAGSAEEMAVAQGRLAASVSKANRALAMQGAETTRVARAQERTRKGGGLGGMAGGIVALGGAEVAVKAVEAGASLEQMKFRLRGFPEATRQKRRSRKLLLPRLRRSIPQSPKRRRSTLISNCAATLRTRTGRSTREPRAATS